MKNHLSGYAIYIGKGILPLCTSVCLESRDFHSSKSTIYTLSQGSERSLKLEHITAAVVKQLQTSCGECAPEMIDNQFFVCYPESPSHVTYRARLEGTSERGSDYLISLIEDWVRGGPGVIVTGVLMTVDSHCSVAISSLSEGECLPHGPSTDTDTPIISDPSPSPELRITDPTAIDQMGPIGSDDGGIATAIIGGVVAIVIVLIIAITIAIVVIVFLVLKSRGGELSLKKSDIKYVVTLHFIFS